MLKTDNWTKVQRNHSNSMECFLGIIILKIKYLYCIFNDQLWYYSHKTEYRIKDTLSLLWGKNKQTEKINSWWAKKRKELCRGRGTERKTGGCKRKISSALKDELGPILSQRRKIMLVLYLLLPNQIRSEFRGIP